MAGLPQDRKEGQRGLLQRAARLTSPNFPALEPRDLGRVLQLFSLGETNRIAAVLQSNSKN